MTFFRALGLMLVATTLLWCQIANARREGIADLPGSSWRFWDDMTLAIARYVDATSGAAPMETNGATLGRLVVPYRELVNAKVATFQIEPHQIWRTVNDRQFRGRLAPFGAPENEDPGRSLLLLFGFRALGGVAPYLLLWIGALAFIPPFFWITYEFVSHGLTVAAATFASLVAFSPFWFECLSLPHSAIAFYLGALVALAAFSLAVFLPRAGKPLIVRHQVVRTVLLSATLIVALWCRGGALAFLPVALVVAAIGFMRSGLSRVRSVLAASLLLLLPALAFRPHQMHNVWLPLWEGLGDFGADHGYSWFDADAGRFLARQGLPLRLELRYVSAEEEAVFKKAFISGVQAAPLWYAGILAKRFVATLGMTHLAPYGPRDGESRKTPLFHYKYATSADWFGWRDDIREVPVSLLYAPTVLLLAWGVFQRGRILGEAGVLVAIGIAALPVPILISTASGLETQAFTLVYFLGAAFLAQRIADTLMNRSKRA